MTDGECPQGGRHRCKGTLQGRGLQGGQREERGLSLMTHAKKQSFKVRLGARVLQRLGEQMRGK